MKFFKCIYAFFIPLILFFSCTTTSEKHIYTPEGDTINPIEFTDFIQKQMSDYKVPGLGIAVLNGDQIVYHKTLGVTSLESLKKVTDKTVFEAASLSKPLFAYFVMKQVEKGVIDLDTPLFNYVNYTDIEHDERHRLITPRMVLSHTTGLPNWRKDTLNLLFTPGTKYQYSGEGFQYLARATAKANNVTRDGLFEIFKQEVALPLNATRLYYNWNEDVATYKAYGHKNGIVGSNGPSDFRTQEFGSAHNLHSDIESYAHFISAMITGKNISKKMHQEMLKAQVTIPDDDFEKLALGNTHWSLGFGIKNTPNGLMYSHGGNNGYFTSFTIFYPEKKFGLVLFSNSEKIMFSNFTNEIASYLKTDLHIDMSIK